MSQPFRLGAVVLAGGTAARMGGIDKASIEVDGVTLLERSLAATASAVEVVVVGTEVPTSRPVTWTREDPAGGGPAAGLLAGLDRFLRPPDLVCVLAVDTPRVEV
ncbi:MAG: molybdenum cofactor guanylyltransferase, partial [Oryzihumus sp.]